jgi:hypothetical protein
MKEKKMDDLLKRKKSTNYVKTSDVKEVYEETFRGLPVARR